MDTTHRASLNTSFHADQLGAELAHRPAPRRAHSAPHHGMKATLLAVALAAGVAPTAHVAADTPTKPPGGCLLSAAANSMAFDVTALLTTVRSNNGSIEMLHDAHCTDGRTGTVWIASHII